MDMGGGCRGGQSGASAANNQHVRFLIPAFARHGLRLSYPERPAGGVHFVTCAFRALGGACYDSSVTKSWAAAFLLVASCYQKRSACRSNDANHKLMKSAVREQNRFGGR